ncbi:unnamed protein product [Lactuca saligna]|uniref:Uncharacterized protein n=1 Tax=Lactuca saligna TaxID=75948 RepID=A0AA35Z883_LACSI|nr:unnamed protein product [Lactuca saligna]
MVLSPFSKLIKRERWFFKPSKKCNGLITTKDKVKGLNQENDENTSGIFALYFDLTPHSSFCGFTPISPYAIIDRTSLYRGSSHSCLLCRSPLAPSIDRFFSIVFLPTRFCSTLLLEIKFLSLGSTPLHSAPDWKEKKQTCYCWI